MIVIRRDPSRRDLRWFAAGLAVLVAVAGALQRHAGSHRAAAVVWCCGAVVVAIAFVSRRAGRGLYVGWMFALFPVAWLVSYAILVAVYFAVATPTGLMMRWLGRDPLQRRFDPEASTYWTPREPNRDRSRYFRQF